MAEFRATEPKQGASPPPDDAGAAAEASPPFVAGTGDLDADGGPLVTVTAPAANKPSGRLPRLARGAVIGRYVVIDLLGKGGMGDVYAAYDPELDRRIALKLVRDVTGDGRERLIAEAKTMARVSHPNVCAVYDAGTFDAGVFIAMELIDGQTLGEWRRTPRTRGEIVGVFEAAGHGLSAAHGAGIVHRDFKPGNVMIGRDGRVRVLDFGLARVGVPHGAGDLVDTESGSSPGDDASLRVLVSRAVGTPSYMAPEQRKPGIHDARVDQFSFAVALYEALHGERPFAGDDLDTITFNALGHRVRPAPRDRDVPAWIRRLLIKALSPDPADRFASLDLLLVELRRDPVVRRRRIAFGAAAVAVVGLAVVGLTAVAVAPQPGGATPCAGADRPALELWNDRARARLETVFAATGRSYAGRWATRVGEELGRRARALGAARLAACQATSVRREQSPALLDLRMACLDRRAAELGALVTRLGAAPDVALMDRALDAVASLPSLDACDDASSLLTAAPRPRDPARQADLVATEAAVAEVRASAYAADTRRTRERAREVVAAAERAGWNLLLAEALVADADAALAAGEYAGLDDQIDRAAKLAAESRSERTIAQVWITAVRVLTALGRPREGLAIARAANAALARIDRPALLRASLLEAESLALEATGDFAAAMARDDEALSLRSAAAPTDELPIGSVLNHRAILASRQGDHVTAEASHRRVLALRSRLLGDGHPDVASSLDNLGAVIYHQGRLDEAVTLYEQAHALRLTALGPDHEDVGTSLNNLGGAFLDRGDLVRAEDHFARALATWERSVGKEHPMLAIPLGNLGDVALIRGDATRAFELCARALALEEKASGERSPELAYSLTCQGEALVAAGRLAEALETLERALALREGAVVDAVELARTRLALATALSARGLDRARVVKLAEAARAVLATAGSTWSGRLTRAEALLVRKQE